MPAIPLSEEHLQAVVDAWRAHDCRADRAADSWTPPMNRKTFASQLALAKARRLHLSEGARDSAEKAKLSGLEVRGGHRRVYDDDGKQIDTIRYTVPQDAETEADIIARMVEAFSAIPPAPRVAAPSHVNKGFLGIHIVADLHMGATITKEEAGIEYNRQIAEERVRTGFAQCNAAMPPCEVAVVAYNGDTTHANDDKHRTPKSGHPLRVEGSHQSNLFGVEVMLSWQVDEALVKHERVVIVIKPGNHDPNTPAPLIMAMRARYRDNPRVTVIDSEDPYFHIQMGRVFLCTHHGDGASPSKRALSIPHKFRREWGVSDFHWFFSADKHHAKADTFGGLHWRQVPSIISLEQHAHGEGYADTSGMYAAWFDTATGRVSETEIRF